LFLHGLNWHHSDLLHFPVYHNCDASWPPEPVRRLQDFVCCRAINGFGHEHQLQHGAEGVNVRPFSESLAQPTPQIRPNNICKRALCAAEHPTTSLVFMKKMVRKLPASDECVWQDAEKLDDLAKVLLAKGNLLLERSRILFQLRRASSLCSGLARAPLLATRVQEVSSCRALEKRATQRPKVRLFPITGTEKDLWRAVFASLDEI